MWLLSSRSSELRIRQDRGQVCWPSRECVVGCNDSSHLCILMLIMAGEKQVLCDSLTVVKGSCEGRLAPRRQLIIRKGLATSRDGGI
jgi:hypothetical protein